MQSILQESIQPKNKYKKNRKKIIFHEILNKLYYKMVNFKKIINFDNFNYIIVKVI